jgi:hypothetical protein
MEITIKAKVKRSSTGDAEKESYKAVFSDEVQDSPSVYESEDQLVGMMLYRLLEVIPVARRMCALAYAVDVFASCKTTDFEEMGEPEFAESARNMLKLWKEADEKSRKIIENIYSKSDD